jgi:hypothetical protein
MQYIERKKNLSVNKKFLPEFHHDLEAIVLEVQLSLALSNPTLAITRTRTWTRTRSHGQGK